MLVRNIKGESKLLETIELFLDGYYYRDARLLDAPWKHVVGLYQNKFNKPIPKKWHYNRAIKRLKDSGRIRIVEENGKFFIKLTQKGHTTILLKKLRSADYKDKQWDGRWRLMIWDIPETSRKERDAIRHFVKRINFFQLQYSVFITPFELAKDAVDYLDESGLISYIRFLRVDKLDNDKGLLKHFGLQ